MTSTVRRGSLGIARSWESGRKAWVVLPMPTRGSGGQTAAVILSTARARPNTRERLVTGAFVRLTGADVAYFTSVGVAIYALPLWVTGPVGSDKSGAGLAFGAFAVSALVLRPVAGRLADTRGRRPLLVGGALLSALGMLGTAYAESLALVVLLRLILGVAEAAFFVASIAALIDLAPPSRIGEATSYNSLGLYLGLAFGPPLAELLVRTGGFRAAWYGAAILSLIAAAVAAKITNLRPAAPTDRPAKLIHWKAVPVALGFFASVVAMGALFAFGSLQANAVGLMPTSTPLFVYGLVVVAGRLSLARFLDRFPPLWLGAVALMITASGLLIMALWNAPIGVTFGAGVLALASRSARRLSSLRSSQPQHQANGVPPPVRRVCFSILQWAAARCYSGWWLKRAASPSPSASRRQWRCSDAYGSSCCSGCRGPRPQPGAPVEPCVSSIPVVDAGYAVRFGPGACSSVSSV